MKRLAGAGVPERRADRIQFGGDARDLAEPQLVDLLGGPVEGERRAHQPTIVGLSPGILREPHGNGRLRQIRPLQPCEEPVERRVHPIDHLGGQLLLKARHGRAVLRAHPAQPWLGHRQRAARGLGAELQQQCDGRRHLGLRHPVPVPYLPPQIPVHRIHDPGILPGQVEVASQVRGGRKTLGSQDRMHADEPVAIGGNRVAEPEGVRLVGHLHGARPRNGRQAPRLAPHGKRPDAVQLRQDAPPERGILLRFLLRWGRQAPYR